jgi:diadenosine tetraphosphatase ApaH/serine/threonine PP2A family protein phosphatase
MTLLLAFAVMYPNSVVLLRGNHEFEQVNCTYGFQTEVASQFNSIHVFSAFNAVFNWMPLIALVNNSVICVHGGISPSVRSIRDLYRLHPPLMLCDVEPVSDLLWSDPSSECETILRSARGLGVQFSAQALQEFLTATGMTKMFRAHQCVQNGVASFADDRLYTVFSSSSYEGAANRCGLVFLDPNLHVHCFSLPPIELVPREAALLRPVSHEEVLKGVLETDPFAIRMLDLKQAGFAEPRRSANAIVRDSTAWNAMGAMKRVVGMQQSFDGLPTAQAAPKRLVRAPKSMTMLRPAPLL